MGAKNLNPDAIVARFLSKENYRYALYGDGSIRRMAGSRAVIERNQTLSSAQAFFLRMGGRQTSGPRVRDPLLRSEQIADEISGKNQNPQGNGGQLSAPSANRPLTRQEVVSSLRVLAAEIALALALSENLQVAAFQDSIIRIKHGASRL